MLANASVRLVCMLYLWVLWNILLAYGVFIIASPTHSKYSINVYLLGRVTDSLVQTNHILIMWTIFLWRILTELGGQCFWGKIPNGLLSSSLENCVDLSLGRTKQFALPITMNPGFIEVCNKVLILYILHILLSLRLFVKVYFIPLKNGIVWLIPWISSFCQLLLRMHVI